MPRGGKKGHKGRGKQFSNPEEIDRQMRAQREREENGDAECKSSSESEEESSSEDEKNQKRSGVEGLIEIENPNRVSQKNKNIAEVDVSVPKELSRREREEIEKQKAKERYMKLHLEGKTEQARADLARLAIIKKQREEAARKREEMRKGSRGGAGAYPSSLRAEGRIHPGQVASPSQGDRQTDRVSLREKVIFLKVRSIMK
uniref:Casein kinase substrate phosphoprotein PP28 domain-containing protein n=1 Tax=Pygocentrus nattereri TaxID=42514 RepID=A0AAR2KAM0_PYGNA